MEVEVSHTLRFHGGLRGPDTPLYPSRVGSTPPRNLAPGSRRSLERNLARLGTRKRGRKFLIWRDNRSGPLPPALLTNAFANPLEVCAAGAIIMTPSYLLLQRTSLCCAKMRMSVLDDGGEVMAKAIGCIGSPRACQRATSRLWCTWCTRRESPGVDGSTEPPELQRGAGAKLVQGKMYSGPRWIVSLR